MLFRGVALVALLAAVSAADEDVVLRAEAAASACRAAGAGAAPHPWDPQLLVLCAAEHAPLTVVHCPPGTRASNQSRGCQAIDDASASPRPRRQQGSASPNVARGCEGGAGLVCDGCDKLLVCTQEDNRVRISQTISCSSLGTACNKKKNTCDKDTTCPSGADSGFRCLQEGSFPDPEDCKRYHVCNEKLEHFTDVCGSTYDAANGKCIDGAPCSNPPYEKCAEDKTESKAITKSPSFYRVCLPQSPPNKGYATSVMSCPAEQTFDDSEAKCSYKCESPTDVKRYRDPLDCHKYYECPGKDSKAASKSCSAGLGYDSERKMCVPEAKAKECLPATTTTTTTTTTAPPTKPPPTKAPTKAPPPPAVDCPLFTTYRKDLGYCAWGLFG